MIETKIYDIKQHLQPGLQILKQKYILYEYSNKLKFSLFCQLMQFCMQQRKISLKDSTVHHSKQNMEFLKIRKTAKVRKTVRVRTIRKEKNQWCITKKCMKLDLHLVIQHKIRMYVIYTNQTACWCWKLMHYWMQWKEARRLTITSATHYTVLYT